MEKRFNWRSAAHDTAQGAGELVALGVFLLCIAVIAQVWL